jgi:hypothetical protein
MTTKSTSTTHHASSTTAHAEPAPKSNSSTSTETSQHAAAAALITMSGSKSHNTKVDLQAQYQSLIAGLQKYYLPTDTFHLAQGTLTRDAIIAEVQKFVYACQQTQEANQEWRGMVQAERTAELGIRTLRKGVRGIVLARFGVAAPAILKFGFTLPKVTPKTAETKAIAAQKGKATREARGTTGSTEKKKIKGNVNVALVVTPAGAGAATTAATAAAATPVVNTVLAAAAAPVGGASSTSGH